MQNIPRRKIYETLLEYEDGLIEMQIMLYSQENYEKFSLKFNSETYAKIELTYRKIKALLVMFLDNKKYTTGDEFETALNALLIEEKSSNWKIFKNRNFPAKFKYQCFKLDKIFKNIKKVSSYKHAKELYMNFDGFNHYIPKLLEIRRDHMK